MKKEKRVIYYKNTLTDDFAGTSINQKKISEKYNYVPKNFFFGVTSWFLYHIIAKPLVFLMVKIIYHQKFVNKKLIKKSKGKPYFIYANHTNGMLDAYTPNIIRNRKNYILVNPDAISIKGVRFLVKCLGGIPVPNTRKSVKNYMDSINYIVKHKNSITIYPEAHIWPYYTKIREFSDHSFRYPVDNNTPVYSLTNVYVKSKCFYRKKPRVLSVISGPFYKNNELSRLNQIKDLRNRVYNSMVDVSLRYNQEEYIKYIQVDESLNKATA